MPGLLIIAYPYEQMSMVPMQALWKHRVAGSEGGLSAMSGRQPVSQACTSARLKGPRSVSTLYGLSAG